MKRRIVSLALVCIGLQASLGTSWCATSNPIVITDAPAQALRLVIVGATLGDNWTGFPNAIAPSFNPQQTYQQLDVELPLYISWLIDTYAGYYEPVQLNPPQPITSTDWFPGFHDRFVYWNQYGPVEPIADGAYKPCPDGLGLEAPRPDTTPLTFDGKLRLADIHGGIGDETVLRFVDCYPDWGEDCLEFYNIFVSWTRPGTWFDDQLGISVDRTPGTSYNRAIQEFFGGYQFQGYVPVRIVHWPSSDIGIPQSSASPSPRYVDAADLAYFYTCLGRPNRWGFETETPPLSPTYQCNVNPFDSNPSIGAGDLALLVTQLGTSCQLSKPSGGDEVAAILDWFGIAATGRTVVAGPRGETLPEYDFVSVEKAQRASADPYGYRKNLNSAAVKEVPWGIIKQLYR